MALAITIINPGLLYAGAALASIPIIIHLLNRLRYKRVVWAAMEFLLAAHRKNARRIRLEHLILLIIRTLVILLLAAALGRPIIHGLLAKMGRSAVHRVIVFDDSFSMGAQYGVSTGGETVLKQARKALDSLMKTFDERDGLSLVTAGSRPHVRIGPPSFNRQQVLDEIEKLNGSDSATDMIGALTEAKKIVGESKLEQKIVYILTDNTRAAWKDESGKDLRGLASAIVDKPAGLVVIDLGRNSRPNLALRTVYPERPVVTANVLSAFRVEVENLGDLPVEGVVVQMKVDDQAAPPVVFGRLGPRKVEARKWTYVFDRPGEHVVVGSLKDSPQDALAVDNRRFLALEVKEALNVLLVDGEPRPGLFQNETDYLRAALDPRGPDEQRETIFQVTTLGDTELDAAQARDFDVVVLANVASLKPQQYERFKQFVRDGGSLIIFVGDQVQLQEYNRSFYENGQGLLPASLAAPVGAAEAEPGPGAPGFVTFDVRHFEHPALAAFKERGEGAGLNTVRVYKYLQLKLPPDAGETSVMLYFQDGNPALVEKKFGRGRVILWAVTADIKWTNFPQLPGFLELIHEMMDYMMPDVLWRYNRLVDSETSIAVPAGQSRQSMTLYTPSRGQVNVRPSQAAADRFVLQLDRLNECGFYRLDTGRAPQRFLAVNLDTAESSLDHLTGGELSAQLGHVPLVFAEGQEGLAKELQSQQAAGGWARNLLYAMLGLLLLETFLAWFFNRGR